MKRTFLVFLACCLLPLWAIGGPPPSEKQFTSGVSGLGFRWDACREGDTVHYVVFAYGPRPRELGEEKPGKWVNVTGVSSRDPKARLRLAPREERDLLAGPDRIYQIDREGRLSTFDERVTAAEFNAFMGSYPQQYTAEALLTFVRAQRAARE